MQRNTAVMVLLIVLAWAAPAPAQSIFSKKPKPNPSQRVPELILIVKTDTDERKRANAAAELHEYDATAYAEILPVLADVALHDKKSSVRHEAINSLAKIRPVNAVAGHALEKAAAEDDVWRVRFQAKTALTKYHLAGYSPKKTEAPPSTAKKTTPEPPLVAPLPPPSVSVAPPPRPLPVPSTPTVAPRPLPVGPATTPASGQGPSLFP